MENNRESYNKYVILPQIPYKILEHLFVSPDAEIIWKLLDYKNQEDWNKPNLTLEQKRKLVYGGEIKQEDYNIFLDFALDEAVTKETAFLRIYPSTIYPENRVTGIVGINFEILVHTRINHLSNYQTRIDTILQALIQTLNGVNVGGIGNLFFDADGSSFDSVRTMAQKPYKGKLLIMSTIVA